MIKTQILHKDHLLPLLRKLGKQYRLVGPVRNRFGDTLYIEITDLDRVEIDLRHQPQNSLKSFFFPQTEPLASYIVDTEPASPSRLYSFHPLLPENRPTLYFGVRSCDLFAVLYMDLIFLGGKHRDIYYEQRRRGAVFVSLGCNEPFANCFCNATKNGPFLEFGFDLQLTDLGPGRNSYFVEAGKANGVNIINKWAHFFTVSTKEDRRFQYQAALEARSLFKQFVHVDLACRELEKGNEPTEVLTDFSQRCQDCGGCAFICPTCTCFSIIDQMREQDSGERIRSWDACTFAGFTRMAGDHNPVDMRRHRIRKRFFHKLKHDVRKHGRPSCVGCGRCVDMCFGGVDILRFINAITEAGNQGRSKNHGV